MGMFDDLKCEVPLPDGYVGEFQTKDFDCAAAHYAIRADGHLEVLRFKLVPRPNWESIADGSPFNRENERWETVPYHGLVRFYTYDTAGLPPLAPHDEARWHEYEAKFTDGLLAEITTVTSTTETAEPSTP